MKIKLLALILIITSINMFSQSTTPPKKEFRAAWIATVTNLDWPANPNLSIEQQKSSLIAMLDVMKACNMNVAVFQVRTECDALYKSTIEPWSYWLTGAQGLAPASSDWDPLQFAIEESHKRGMELHAWVNPYRAVKTIGNYPISSQHITTTHPEWILTFSSSKLKILNPGIPDVRDYNLKVVMDIVNRYDVDGLHMDDYFYPYDPVISTEDAATFQQYPNGFTNIGNWRRNNVNVMMKMVMDSINAVKPYVKFGISPFGIWKPGYPAGITGLNSYDVLFADPMAWLRAGSIDYLTPQLYWKIGGNQDYSKLMPWWADSTYKHNRMYVPGHIFNAAFTNTELPRQVTLNRNNPKVSGSMFFRMAYLQSNDKGFADSLKNNYYKYKCIIPPMNWKDVVVPNPPQNLAYSRVGNSPIAGFKWDLPNIASDGDSAKRYVLYQFDNALISSGDISDPKKIIDVVGSRTAQPKTLVSATGDYFFLATSLDRNNNESDISNIVQVAAPSVPALAYPNNGALNQPDDLVIKWNYANPAASYRLQISVEPNFTTTIIDQANLTDTSFAIINLMGQKTFYWRVKAANVAGESGYSEVRSFTTGYPVAPLLVYPTNNTSEIPLQFTYVWKKTANTDSYGLQVAKSRNFVAGSIVLDTLGLTDTTFVGQPLEPNRFHFYRVISKNNYGSSLWSDVFAFRTRVDDVDDENVSIPNEFLLKQNYPNPFNPTTKISFNLINNGFTTLHVYNILGEVVATLVNGELSKGTFEVVFDATGLPSGIYIYSLKSNGKQLSNKMMLVK
ncbi:MAG: family 10 glycosylhydrolase [bacterium]